MEYGRLVLQRWDQGADRIPDLQVYGPPPIARMTEQLFGVDGIYGPDIRARVEHRSSLDVFEARGGTLPRRRPNPRVTEIHAGSVIEGNGWKLTAGHAQHVQPYLECLAFRLDTKEGSVCYTGDSGASDRIVELAKGCDLLIHMNHYFSGTEPTPAYRAACGNHRDNALDRQALRRQDAGADPSARPDQTSPGSAADRSRDPGRLRRQSRSGEDLMRFRLSGARIANIEPKPVSNEIGFSFLVFSSTPHHMPIVLYVMRQLLRGDGSEARAVEVLARLLFPHGAESFALLRERDGHAECMHEPCRGTFRSGD